MLKRDLQSLASVVALLASTTVVAFGLTQDPNLAKRLDQTIDAALDRKQIVGAVVLITRDGTIVYRRAAGYADRERQVPVGESTIFRLASMTKPIVSATALALVERGQLSLDDPVTRWLPEFRPALSDGRGPTITIRELLTHTSGLSYGFLESPNGPYHRAHVSDGMDQPGLSIEGNLRRIASRPLLFEPGTKWQYSVALDVLGEVVARASHSTLPEAVKKYVTGPLGMTDTAFKAVDTSRLATPYADGKPEPIRMTDSCDVAFGRSAIVFSPSRIFNPKSYPSGGAGMAGTASDYLRFLEALRTGGEPILKPTTVRLMTTNQTGNIELPLVGEGWHYGFGFAVLEDPKATRSHLHPGSFQWGGVWGSHFWVDPTAGLSVVILTNTAIAGMIGPFPNSIERAVYGDAEGEKAKPVAGK